MQNIKSLERSFDVRALLEELARQPHLWDRYRWRIGHPRSPHREASDIWLRYNDIQNLGDHFNDYHESVWYPVASDLPAAQTLVYEMMEFVQGKELGGVLITRIPPGKQVYPHVDGGWHACHYEKFAIQLRGHPDQAFCFQTEELRPMTGDSYWFNNQFPHWVTNNSDEDRITLIICIRRSH